MVADAAARPARRVRLPVPLAVGVRRLARASREARRARHRGRDRGLRRDGIRTGRGRGRASRARTRSPTRCVSSASGERCARTPPSAVCGSSATCRSTSSDEGADFAGWPELFTRGEVAGAPPTRSTSRGSSGGTRSTTGPRTARPATAGGVERFRRTYELVDLCRIDHFRGFVSYWAIPERHATAKRGRWRPGPGIELFRAVERDARRPAGDRRGSRPDHAGRVPAARRARPAGHGGSPLGLWRLVAQTSPAREPRPQPGRLHEHARHRHRRGPLRRQPVGRGT